MIAAPPYVAELAAEHSCIREIWLFGSRANGPVRADSDWDFLVWTDDPRLLNRLARDERFRRPDIDVLVVNGPFAVSPWPQPDGWRKKLRLDEDLHWHQLSSTQAEYLQTKKRNPEDRRDIAVDMRTVKAFRLYCRQGG